MNGKTNDGIGAELANAKSETDPATEKPWTDHKLQVAVTVVLLSLPLPPPPLLLYRISRIHCGVVRILLVRRKWRININFLSRDRSEVRMTLSLLLSLLFVCLCVRMTPAFLSFTTRLEAGNESNASACFCGFPFLCSRAMFTYSRLPRFFNEMKSSSAATQWLLHLVVNHDLIRWNEYLCVACVCLVVFNSWPQHRRLCVSFHDRFHVTEYKSKTRSFVNDFYRSTHKKHNFFLI